MFIHISPYKELFMKSMIYAIAMFTRVLRGHKMGYIYTY